MKQIKIKIRNHYESVQFNYRTISEKAELIIKRDEQIKSILE